MSSPSYAILFSARVSGAAANGLAGDILIPDSVTGQYVLATSAARGTRRATGVALAVYAAGGSVEIQQFGQLDPTTSRLGAGAATWIRVSSAGILERVTTPTTGDDVVGSCEADGTAHLLFGVLTPNMVTGTGGGTVPTVTAISPTSGSAAGGTSVSITVNSSTGCTGATVGGVALTSFAIVDATHVSGTTGAHAAGANDVIVSNATGASSPLVGAFTFVAAPTVTAIAPNVGDTAGGGGIVTITGTAFTGATGVTIGGTAATSVTVVNATTITCVPGAHASGANQSVLVTTAGGTNGANTLFEYWTPAQITGVDIYLDANKGVTGGAAVSAWTDQSANARSFTQATGANKPAQTASVFGTLPSIQFSAAGPQFVSLGAKITLASGQSVFAVAKWTATTNATSGNTGNCPLTIVGDRVGAYNAFGATAGLIRSNHLQSNGSTIVLVDRGSGLNDGNPHLIGATYDATVNVIDYLGATQQGATNTDAGGLATGNGYDTIGAGYSGDGWTGDIGAVVIVSGVIGGTDLTKLNSWAKQRFGTP